MVPCQVPFAPGLLPTVPGAVAQPPPCVAAGQMPGPGAAMMGGALPMGWAAGQVSQTAPTMAQPQPFADAATDEPLAKRRKSKWDVVVDEPGAAAPMAAAPPGSAAGAQGMAAAAATAYGMSATLPGTAGLAGASPAMVGVVPDVVTSSMQPDAVASAPGMCSASAWGSPAGHATGLQACPPQISPAGAPQVYPAPTGMPQAYSAGVLPAGMPQADAATGYGASTVSAAQLGNMAGFATAAAFNLTAPKPRYIRQKDDWRWSKGTDALRSFEEVQLPLELQELASKVLGEGSRYPTRVADATDCAVELTVWGTILLRPKGTGANPALAKKMLYDVMHPASKGEELRRVSLAESEEPEVVCNDLAEALDSNGPVQRNKQNRFGLGAEVSEEPPPALALTTKEILLATAEDIRLVHSHLNDIRIASAAQPALLGAKLMLSGKDPAIEKAVSLVATLLETGEWAALSEAFVLSQETINKRRKDEGVSEQILLKVAEGPTVKLVERHLKAIANAAGADDLKLTAKAVAGRRTLMIDGTRAAHERVKWMVRELGEKGESVMLNKVLLGGAREPSATPKPGIAIGGQLPTTPAAAWRLAPRSALQAAPAQAAGALFGGLPPPCESGGYGDGLVGGPPRPGGASGPAATVVGGGLLGVGTAAAAATGAAATSFPPVHPGIMPAGSAAGTAMATAACPAPMSGLEPALPGGFPPVPGSFPPQPGGCPPLSGGFPPMQPGTAWAPLPGSVAPGSTPGSGPGAAVFPPPLPGVQLPVPAVQLPDVQPAVPGGRTNAEAVAMEEVMAAAQRELMELAMTIPDQGGIVE
eukprot:NODE_1409_length_2487_cov_5.353390.p1 GENE.NODE_1409_length_2487_cov_5.353390~~NODE_1409_length_2487_cov_5.353390.p1  ORF type:complete len:817 (+),score=225.02 NODE_1409_length_2487_cov_5.353390:3-2453(+)